jgi:phage tail sheath protein FI
MSFLVSPGVDVNEIDLTNVIPAVSTSIGGYVGEFRWGPIEEAITVSSEKELASYYGTPDSVTIQSFLTAASFLKYGNALKVSRIQLPNASNASVNTPAGLTGDTNVVPIIKNYGHFLSQQSTLATNYKIIAKCPGSIANGLTVVYAFGGGAVASPYNTLFNNPTTGISSYSAKNSLNDSQLTEKKDEIHIAIIDSLGLFTGTLGSVLEVWEGLSVFTDAKKDDGSSNYYVEVINKNSSYIYVTTAALTPTFKGNMTRAVAYTNAGGAFTIVSGNGTFTLGTTDSQGNLLDDGTDGTAGSLTNFADAANVFSDAETIDVNLLFTSSNGTEALNAAEQKLLSIAIDRKDCVAFISAPLTIATATSDANRLSALTAKFSAATSTSYAVFDSTPLYVYNKYADNYVYIPECGHMAGLCANTDNVAEPWFSPAGYNRGNLLGVTKLAFNPKQADRDTIYKARINPIVSFPGQGILLFGDKTAQSKPSAFDRINVRRLFITLEKAIATAAKYQLFELNDEFTRAMFRNMVEPFLREVKGRRGVTDFLVVCDETNNTGEVIDTNRFVADIYIKPARSINFITLNFIATRTGVQFSELVGK